MAITADAPAHERWLIGRIDAAVERGALTEEKAATKRAAVPGTIHLAKPKDPCLVREIQVAMTQNVTRAAGAALGVCWASGGTLHRPVKHYNGLPMQYGHAVFNALVGRGWEDAEVEALGMRAYVELMDDALLAAALQEVLGNSDDE
ncbi:MAG: hypothetical protein GY913_00775 [Proteobacteria bacterium]|nr:hypothetical protein [Pseudomonadota bacterium]